MCGGSMSCKIRYKWYVGRIKVYHRIDNKLYKLEKKIRVDEKLRPNRSLIQSVYNEDQNKLFDLLYKRQYWQLHRPDYRYFKWPYILFNIKIYIPSTSV